jgi:signal transduction histidine kinase
LDLIKKLHNSLGKKVITYVFSIYLVIATFVTAGQMYFEFSRVQSQLLKDIKQVSTTLKPVLSEHLWNLDNDGMKRSFDRIIAIEKVLGLKVSLPDGKEMKFVGAILDDKGKILTDKNTSPDMASNVFEQLLGYDFDIHYSLPGDKTKYHIGKATIFTGNSVVLNTVRYGFLLILINSILKTLALWLIIYFFIFKIIERPITSLASNIKNLKLENLDQQQELFLKLHNMEKREDQLGDLARSYLVMFESMKRDYILINKKNDEIENYNRNLEEKVKERTRQLNIQNAKLTNTVEELNKTQKLLIHQEKLAFLGTLSAGISHEIKNPLNLINNFATIIETEVKVSLPNLLININQPSVRTEIEQSLNKISDMTKVVISNGTRANSIINSMLLQSRSGGATLSKVNLEKLFIENMDIIYHSIKAKYGIYVVPELDFDDVEDILVYPQELGRVLINILDNAFYSLSQKKLKKDFEGHKARLSLSIKKLDNTHISLSITDNGVGIKPELLDKIIEPFYTSKPAGFGTGLGLSMVKDIIENRHHGKLIIESEFMEYAKFTIVLPVDIEKKLL